MSKRENDNLFEEIEVEVIEPEEVEENEEIEEEPKKGFKRFLTKKNLLVGFGAAVAAGAMYALGRRSASSDHDDEFIDVSADEDYSELFDRKSAAEDITE